MKRKVCLTMAIVNWGVCIFAILLMAGGCGTVPHRPSFCTDDEPSLIYDMAEQLRMDPVSLSSLIVIANIEAIDRSPQYTEEAARGAIKNLKQLLAGGAPTYFDVISLAQQNVGYVNQYAGREIMLIGLFMPALSSRLPITDCDLKCFLYQLEAMEKSMDAYFGTKTSMSMRQWVREDPFFAQPAVHYMRSWGESPPRYERLGAALR